MGKVERLQIVSLTVAMAAAAFTLLATGVVDGDPPAGGSFSFPAITLIALFAAAEAAVVHVLLRRQTVSASLSEIPLVLGLFFVSPVMLVLTRLGGSFFALVLWRRQPTLKALYNFGYFSLETVLIIFVFQRILGDGALFGPAGWAAALVASLVGIVVAFASVCLAIWVTERSIPAEVGRTLVRLGIPTTLVNVLLGLLAATLIDIDGRTGALMLAFASGMFLLYRSHSRLLKQPQEPERALRRHPDGRRRARAGWCGGGAPGGDRRADAGGGGRAGAPRRRSARGRSDGAGPRGAR